MLRESVVFVYVEGWYDKYLLIVRNMIMGLLNSSREIRML